MKLTLYSAIALLAALLFAAAGRAEAPAPLTETDRLSLLTKKQNLTELVLRFERLKDLLTDTQAKVAEARSVFNKEADELSKLYTEGEYVVNVEDNSFPWVKKETNDGKAEMAEENREVPGDSGSSGGGTAP